MSQDINTILFRQLLAGFDETGQIAVTKFLNNIVIFRTFHNIQKANDVLTLDSLHYFNLISKGHLEIVIIVDCNKKKSTCISIDDFDSNLLIGFLAKPFVYVSIATSSKNLCQVYSVAFNLFDCHSSYYYTLTKRALIVISEEKNNEARLLVRRRTSHPFWRMHSNNFHCW